MFDFEVAGPLATHLEAFIGMCFADGGITHSHAPQQWSKFMQILAQQLTCKFGTAQLQTTELQNNLEIAFQQCGERRFHINSHQTHRFKEVNSVNRPPATSLSAFSSTGELLVKSRWCKVFQWELGTLLIDHVLDGLRLLSFSL